MNHLTNTINQIDIDDARGRREFPRWYFYNPFTELEDQISGISASIKVSGWWFDRFLANVIIKDLSLGGAGFIVPNHIKIPDKIIITLEDKYKIECDILHRRRLNRYIQFCGARWEPSRRRIVMTIISRYSRMSRFVK